MTQVEMELKFSKRMKDFITLDAFINDTGELMSTLVGIVNEWINGDLYPEQRKLANKLPGTEHIVIEVMLTILTKYCPQQIQGLAVELGVRLGYTDTVEAAKIGSYLLAICHGDLYDIDPDTDNIMITPKIEIDNDAKRKIKQLGFLPPNLVPAIWTSNVGGWQWEKKSCILGSGNHHDEHQSLDVLNQLQQVAWNIDIGVLVNEEHKNATHNEMEILGYYIGEEFYFTWQFDKRGRMYSSSYNISPQGDEYQKALLSPVHAEICTQEGIRALKIDIANYKGMDKLTWAERECLCFTECNWKKPILGRKAERALAKAETGKPVAHFVELDATSSGVQIMAALSGCVKSGRLCNLVDTGSRENLYQHVYDEMSKHTDMTGVECKKPIMTHYYNSVAVPRATFNDEQLEVFYNVLDDMLPGPQSVMDILNDCWNPYALEHSWTLPDNHVCRVKVINKTELRITVPELEDRQFILRYSKNQPSTNGTSIVANVVHSVDAYVCREMVRRCNKLGFEISCIHDAYLTHPNNAEAMKQVYREVLADIADSDLLNDICSQIIGKDAGISIDDEGLSQMILQSSYALS